MRKMSAINKIVRSAAIVFLGTIFAQLIGYLFRIVVARQSIALYGVYNLAFSIITFFIPFVLLGLDQGLIRYISYYEGKKQNQKEDVAVTSALKIVLPVSIVFFLAVYFGSQTIASWFNAEDLALFLRYFAFLIPLIAGYEIFIAVLSANKKIGLIIISRNIINNLLMISIVLIMFVFGYFKAGVISAFLISGIVTFFLLFIYSKRFFKFRKGFDKSLIGFSVALLFLYTFFMIMTKIDTIMLGYFTDVEEVALYNVAVPTSYLLLIFGMSLMSIYLPTITRRFFSKKKIDEEFKFTTKWIFILTLPAALIMIFFSREILTFLFGKTYVSAYIPLSILAFFSLFRAISGPSDKILVMLKKTKLLFFISLICLIVNVILNLILIPAFDRAYGYGMYGAAIATGVSLALMTLLNLFFAYKNTKIRIFNKNYLKIIFSGVISVLVAYLIYYYLKLTSILHVFVFAVLCILLYILLLFLFKIFDKEDKGILKTLRIKNE